ncbi:MAG: hypothetical protein ACR2M1_17455, partial [Gemmatimonadaceae bacterium]
MQPRDGAFHGGGVRDNRRHPLDQRLPKRTGTREVGSTSRAARWTGARNATSQSDVGRIVACSLIFFGAFMLIGGFTHEDLNRRFNEHLFVSFFTGANVHSGHVLPRTLA